MFLIATSPPPPSGWTRHSPRPEVYGELDVLVVTKHFNVKVIYRTIYLYNNIQ